MSDEDKNEASEGFGNLKYDGEVYEDFLENLSRLAIDFMDGDAVMVLVVDKNNGVHTGIKARSQEDVMALPTILHAVAEDMKKQTVVNAIKKAMKEKTPEGATIQ